MKAPRHTTGPARRERGFQDSGDPYLADARLPHAARCPRCHAAYAGGRWTWGEAAEDAVSRTCPACRRIEDNFPAGYVTLRGPFFRQHREEILQLVVAREATARKEHPMQRLIGVEETSAGVVVTTTHTRLARRIASAVEGAFQGKLELTFGRDENLLRAVWTR